ncbi:inclusion body family protein [Flavobacterium sp. LS1R49]|uniref:Inclusion body family protein n=1 Tax=Flavobacterium shii TaxID=2987687 RepID=A0A9X2YVA3_9FLAO|nr:inclusion body family protein [Flavobacterium shii]MCV9928054.1 inclusion body family protein [Flavobacterium shii]
MDSESKNLEASSKGIGDPIDVTNIQIIINTDKIKREYSNEGSKDPANPTEIGHQYQYMVSSSLAGSTGSGSTDLIVNAAYGDFVRLYAISEYANSENAVIIYNIQRTGGADVFNDFRSGLFNMPGIQASRENPLPIQHVDEIIHWYNQADVIGNGAANYNISFALYTADRRSHSMNLIGYFVMKPTFII